MVTISKKRHERLVKQIENVLAIAPMLQEEVSVLLRQAQEICDALPDDVVTDPPKTRAVTVSTAGSNAGQAGRIYDSEGAAKLCGLRMSTLTRLCRGGHGPKHEPRTARMPYQFSKSSIVEWLSQHYIAPEGKSLPRLGKRLLSPTQAGRLAGHSYSRLRWLIASEIMPHLEINGRYFLFREDLTEYSKEAGHINAGG